MAALSRSRLSKLVETRSFLQQCQPPAAAGRDSVHDAASLSCCVPDTSRHGPARRRRCEAGRLRRKERSTRSTQRGRQMACACTHARKHVCTHARELVHARFRTVVRLCVVCLLVDLWLACASLAYSAATTEARPESPLNAGLCAQVAQALGGPGEPALQRLRRRGAPPQFLGAAAPSRCPARRRQ